MDLSRILNFNQTMMSLIIYLLTITVVVVGAYMIQSALGAAYLVGALAIFVVNSFLAGYIFKPNLALFLSSVFPILFLTMMTPEWYKNLAFIGILLHQLLVAYFVSVWQVQQGLNLQKIEELNQSQSDMNRYVRQSKQQRNKFDDESKKILSLSSRIINLKNMARVLGSSIKEKDVLENMLLACDKIMKVERAAIYYLNGKKLVLRAGQNEDKQNYPAEVTDLINEPVLEVFRNKGMMTPREITSSPTMNEKFKQCQLKFQMAAHLGSSQDSLGVFIVEREKGKSLNDEDVQIFSILADLGSLSLRNSALYSKVERLANVDGLTQLFTKRYFEGYMNIEIQKSRRYKKKFSLIMSDIDHFKNFNDSYGHQAGDYVLRKTADVFRAMTRTSDLVSRYGGEEFIAVLPETDAEGAYILAERIREKLEQAEFTYEEQTFKVTASIGIATFPDHSTDLDELIKFCDQSLYYAKDHGRNMTVVYKPEATSE